MDDINIEQLSDAELDRLQQQLEEARSNRVRSRELQCVKECLEITAAYEISVERVVRLLAETIGVSVGVPSQTAPQRFRKGLSYRDPVSGDVYITGGQGKPPAWFSAARQAGILDSMLISPSP